MIRTLFIIAGSAFLLCIVSFAGAAALGGRDFFDEHGSTWIIEDREDGTSIRRRAESDDPAEMETTRTVPWSGGETLTVELAADVTYVQGPAATVVITGPESAVARVRIDGGRLSLADGPERATVRVGGGGIRGWSDTDRLQITVTAPSVTRFDLQGSSDVTLRDYDQDTLAVALAGSGDVTATGRTRALDLDITGSGDVDLSDLATTDATVDVSGSGQARIAPTGEADVSIGGSGDVDLTTRPARLIQDISGSGDVDMRG